MAWTRIYDEAEPQRVNRWLAQNGVCSRREAEALITKGLVSLDGETITDPGRKISRGQTLILSEKAQTQLASSLTVIIHKPPGVVSAHPEPGQTQASDLLTRKAYRGDSAAPSTHGISLPPLGRLDMESRGLLILSEDGVLAKAIIGPDSELDKEYLVEVRGTITPQKLGMLRHGLQLDRRQLRPAKVTVVEGQTLRFILTEGRNRQIRRMCDLVGLYVVDLLRIRIGPLSLGDLPEGRWRLLTPSERAQILSPSRS
ncbi:MAG: pseudouridylate synthase [Phenylobacterium zucineum]|nr:MAG: pseudouridylate synthase [Phenylobacterium zucineum]